MSKLHEFDKELQSNERGMGWSKNGSIKETSKLVYADDIVVMGEMREEVINTTSKLQGISKTISLCVNEEKTKYLMVARRSPAIDHIIVDNSFEKVEVLNT